MKKIIITGSTSTSAKAFLDLIQSINLKVITAGRSGQDFKVDFSSRAETENFCKFVLKEKPHYLFLHHGVLPGQRLEKYNDKLIQSTLQTNLVSILQILEAIVPLENLRTIVTSSISGTNGSFDTLYAASKAGIDVSIRSFAKQIPSSSRLNAIAPGIISDSKMTLARKDLDVLEKKRLQTPTQRFNTALEVAKLVKLTLFENESGNGQIIHINGGLT